MHRVTPLENPTWTEAAKIYGDKKVIGMLFLGFSSGLPYLLVFSTLTAWLAEEDATRSAIGLFAWVGMTYSIKVVWAPIVDHMPLPILGRVLGQRRSWIMLGQILICLGLVGISVYGVVNLWLLAFLSLVVAFGSSTQDIAIDAYRIEAVENRYQGAMSAAYILGYRMALLVAGAGALYLADYAGWAFAYLIMASLVGLGVVTVLMIREPVIERPSSLGVAEMDFSVRRFSFVVAVVEPFRDFFRRNGELALLILLFISLYRLSDIAMGIMANPFYLDMGYSKLEIANITKIFGFFMLLFGSFLGGLLVIKWGVYRCLLVGAIAVAITNVFFAFLTFLSGPDQVGLAFVISMDNLSGGFAATAFVAYLSSLTNRAYTATQYALFSSLMTLPGKFLSGFSGFVVDYFDYFTFFLLAAGLGIPAIVLVFILTGKERDQDEDAVHN